MLEKLVPRTHERSEIGFKIIRYLSVGKGRVREVIPVSGSLEKETTFIGQFLQRLVLGISSSVDILVLPFQSLCSNMSIIVFLRDSHLSCSRIPAILPSSKVYIPSYKSSGTILYLLLFLQKAFSMRISNRTSIFEGWVHQSFISRFFDILGASK